MNRRIEIENIIIGTLLESIPEDNYFNECRCCVTEDMFSDDTNRRIYHLIAEMNHGGKYDTCPSNIYAEYGEQVMDILDAMLEKVNTCSIIYKRWKYNKDQFVRYETTGVRPSYTAVGLSNYVSVLVKMALKSEAV